MSPTPTRTESNRANATHSTGPRTDDGKSRSRFNARRHNLTGQTLLMTGHDLAAYTKSSAALKADLRPQGEFEERLVQSIADAQWQLDRARAIEQNLFFELTTAQLPADQPVQGEAGVDWAQAQARAFLENSRQFELLARYATRFQRQILQLHATLVKAQKDRHAADLQRAQNRLRYGADSLTDYLNNSNKSTVEGNSGFVSQSSPNPSPARPVIHERPSAADPNPVKKQAA